MPVADVPILITPTLSGVPWVVNVDVLIAPAGQPENTRPAEDGEVEVKLLDIGELPGDWIVYHETPWILTFGGMVPFNVTDYSWIVGYDGVIGANRMGIVARLTADPLVSTTLVIRLGTESWTDETFGKTHKSSLQINPEVVVPIGISVVAGLTLLYLAGRR